MSTPRPHVNIMSPEICFTPMLFFPHVFFSEEVKIDPEVDLAAFLLKCDEHSEFMAMEADEVDLFDLAAFAATFVAFFTMMLIPNCFVEYVEAYIKRSKVVLDRIDSTEKEACFSDQIYHLRNKNRTNF